MGEGWSLTGKGRFSLNGECGFSTWRGTKTTVPFSCTLLAIPITLKSALIGFVLFRVMDVVKPPPARQFEHFKGGVGIVADDLMAAVYANLALRGILMMIG